MHLIENQGNEVIRRHMSSSIHSAGISEIHVMPIAAIYRPILPVLNNEKVQSLMRAIQVIMLCVVDNFK